MDDAFYKEPRMIFKGKDCDIEITFEANIDLGFWSIPLSIGVINITFGNLLDRGCILILRVLCFQLSWEIWKWSKEITDVETTTVEDLFDGQL